MNDWLNLLGLANKAGKILTGEDNILNNVRNNKAKLVIVATDASDNTKKQYRDKCSFYNVAYVETGTIKEISSAINKINRVAVGVCDDGFKKGLLAKITK
ncbi:MAG: ribosomal protein L7ae [Haloplasmataceae bacterium]|jgi:ribosomal protein L7Ae-like RNA K-turn-binding protein|nr:ribosomal protein L7ae [Haloplasmataceae bacterium]